MSVSTWYPSRMHVWCPRKIRRALATIRCSRWHHPISYIAMPARPIPVTGLWTTPSSALPNGLIFALFASAVFTTATVSWPAARFKFTHFLSPNGPICLPRPRNPPPIAAPILNPLRRSSCLCTSSPLKPPLLINLLLNPINPTLVPLPLQSHSYSALKLSKFWNASPSPTSSISPTSKPPQPFPSFFLMKRCPCSKFPSKMFSSSHRSVIMAHSSTSNHFSHL